MMNSEKRRLKDLYRKAIQICHPDRAPAHLHSFMAEKAKQLNAAKNAGAFSRVREIAAELGIADAATSPPLPQQVRRTIPREGRKWLAVFASVLFLAAIVWGATAYFPAFSASQKSGAKLYVPNLESGATTPLNRGAVLDALRGGLPIVDEGNFPATSGEARIYLLRRRN